MSKRRQPLPNLQNTYTGILECTAECDECEFHATNRKNAMAIGNIHARTTGHQVRVQQVLGVTYNKKGLEHNYR